MAKQTINVGTTANDRQGDSLRAAFQKVNANFTELYSVLGLDVAPLNLGAFEFTGNTLTTTDSSAIIIDQAVTVTSDLTVGGDIVPSQTLTSTLGTEDKKWHSLYVGPGSLFLDGAKLSLVDGKIQSSVGFNLTGSVGEVEGAVQWDNILSKPTFSVAATSGSYNDLTDKPTIPSIVGLATESYVNDAVGAIVIPDVSNFITADDIPAIPNAAGSTGQIQVNSDGEFSASSELTFDPSTRRMVLGGSTLGIVETLQVTGHAGGILYLSSTAEGGTESTHIALSSTSGVSTTMYGNVSFGSGSSVDFTDAIVNGLNTSIQGFTYSEINDISEIGVTADVFDFGDGKTIDMQNSTILFSGSTFQGLPDPSGLSNNDDINITVNNDDSSSYTWNFSQTGDLTAPGDITTGLFDVGGRFIQDCADGTTSMRWINVDQGAGNIQLIRAYTGDPKLDTDEQRVSFERAQIKLNWQGEVEGSEAQSGITVRAFDRTDPDATVTHDWEFQGTGDLVLPEGGDILDSQGNSVLGGLPTITIPAVEGETYKGLQVSYGMVHSNISNTELNVNKIVIHKPAAPTVTIDPNGARDDFRVSGLGDSDVLAMFVVYGDINGAKSLATLQAFAEAAIDNVILAGGVEGQFETVSAMKANFSANYLTLAEAAGGLVEGFQFYQTTIALDPAVEPTTQQGSGAEFSIVDNGNGTYGAGGVDAAGTNYQVGHKILILGSSLGGVDGINDCVVTVTSVTDGGIVAIFVEGTPAGSTVTTYGNVTGTNYQVGSGALVNFVYLNSDYSISTVNFDNGGSNYVEGDVLTIPGTALPGGVSPDNDLTITVTVVGGGGDIQDRLVSGTPPLVWPVASISDGGEDQYDDANFISTNLFNQIPYNSGEVTAGDSYFGADSEYAVVYDGSIFGIFVTGNSATFIETSGNSGADGESITEAGSIYAPFTPAQTYDNAVTHINVVGDPWAGPLITFTKEDYATANDVDVIEDDSTLQIGITRGLNQGIYNPFVDEGWDQNVSPSGTLWNTDGWDDFSDLETRTYQAFYAAYGSGNLGIVVPGSKAVMYVPSIEKYYAIEWLSWTQNNLGGGFSYTRREIDLDKLQEGIRFPDGTRLKSAEGLGRVKLTSSGGRRIEETHGFNTVVLTERITQTLTTTASRSVVDSGQIWIDTTATTIDDILNDFEAAGVVGIPQFSLDSFTWYDFDFGTSSAGDERGFSVIGSHTYNQGDTIYFRYDTGGAPVVWWDKNDLPGGAANFRGAVIDYHAYTGEATWIGTIHIVDDDGDNNIAHTEVSSGSTDSENDDLWVVNNEGTISYRRIDGEGKTLKIQWTAKVFYGSETYD